MANARVVVPSAARNTSGTSGANAVVEEADKVGILVSVTAFSGTGPTMDISLEWSDDGGTTWAVGEPVDTFTQFTGVVVARAKEFAIKAAAYRVRWTLGGTSPSFTFSVSDYCTP